jgi:hypothetical protein
LWEDDLARFAAAVLLALVLAFSAAPAKATFEEEMQALAKKIEAGNLAGDDLARV